MRKAELALSIYAPVYIYYVDYISFSSFPQARIRNCGKFPIILSEVIEMTTVKEAVAARFQELMKERGIKTNELANRSGVTSSSVYSMLDPRRKEVSVNLVKKLCDGLDITLGEFFAAPVFDELEQEIQ